jgi:hypothetical protein
MSQNFTDYGARLRSFIRSGESFALRPSEDVFNELALELFAMQFAHNRAYRGFCEARKVTPVSVTHWSSIPAMPAVGFKELELTSLPGEERTRVFHSSGTTGQQSSRHFHNAESIAIYEASLLPWFQAHLLPERNLKISFVALTPPPEQAPHSSLAHMFETVGHEPSPHDFVFTGTVGRDGAWGVDLEKTLAVLHECTTANRPVLLLGTAFGFVHLLDFLAGKNIALKLPTGSRALETGGYKGRSRTMPKAELHELITQRLGVLPLRIVCEYGMSELSSQAYDLRIQDQNVPVESPERIFKFPPWARVQIVSPETGREVREGETGLIRIFDLANVRSVMAIQTEDLGIRRDDGFELVGRAAIAEPRGCSLMSI